MREVIMRLIPEEFDEDYHAEILQDLVRCKDCTYWDGTYCADFCTTDPDGYCSWGERRKDGQEMQ